ncbi:MAG: septum formation protein Maf [Pirellulales bacterium]|nr:septum formation protein Maf [Pirellulales bacterium]
MGPMTQPTLILASRSPRRRELLAEAGYRFEVIEPDPAAEAVDPAGRAPEALVIELARRKAADVAARIEAGPIKTSLVLGCDTVAECDGQILGKPVDMEDARRMLRMLGGQVHRVLSGVCLWPVPDGQPQVQVDTTLLRMDPLDDAQLEAYLASGAWRGKAGAFGFQDKTGWVHVLEGSPSSVVGLPMERLAQMLQSFGVTPG